MNRIELLLPAGNLEKLKFALLYGADAVYIGGKQYSLRAQASNFTKEMLIEGVEFAHSINKKVYVTVNVIPRERELDGVIDYLKELESINVDGIIVSSPAILKLAKDYTNLHISISTQESIANSNTVNLFNRVGANRVVLARELSVDEIRNIKKNTNAELEVFVHGGMCSAYSGRCTLSNYLSNRDANRGGCAHSCRWNYDIYKNGNKINEEYFQIASKDLNGIPYIKDLIEIGVDSLKIEGRMKSLNYVSTIAYTYRMLIDDIYNDCIKDIDYYNKLLLSAENRLSSSGFLGGDIMDESNLYSLVTQEANKSFVGIVLDYNIDKMEATIETRNYFTVDDSFEVMSPNELIKKVSIEYIKSNNEIVFASTHALEKVIVKTNIVLKKNDIIRRSI